MSLGDRSKRGPRAHRGLSLMESAISIVLVSILLATALSTVGASKLGQHTSTQRRLGHDLGQSLLNEVLQQPYADESQMANLLTQILTNGSTVSLTLGPELGENSGGTRALFDDIDDYHTWSESPPQSKDGTVMTPHAGWRRTVTLAYVKKDDVNVTRLQDEGAKRITVDVTYNNAPIATVVGLRTLGPPTTELCCLPGGMGVDMLASTCTGLSGTPSGSGTNTLNTSCAAVSGLTPIAHWKFDENSGSSATDSENGFVATLANGAGWATGQSGSALSLDGVNDAAQIPNDSRLVLTSQYTITAWIYKSSVTGFDSIIMKGTAAATNSTYHLRTNGDEVVFGYADGAYKYITTPAANLAINTWYHVAGTYDSATGTLQIYLNGILNHSGTVTGAPPSTTAAVRLGRSDVGDYYHGRIDDLRIYDKVLTAQEILDIKDGKL